MQRAFTFKAIKICCLLTPVAIEKLNVCVVMALIDAKQILTETINCVNVLVFFNVNISLNIRSNTFI
jgi:hypothetical protein